jgi:NhaP-type Na+/H+ or K+/H+ antiporter
MLGQFALVSFGSFGIGVGIGLLSAIFFKHISNLRNHPYIEVSLTMLFAYVSFLVAEISGMSGVMSLFLTGVIMKHYNW